MADLNHPAFLLRMNRLEQHRMGTHLRGTALLMEFNAMENTPEKEKDDLPFSVRYARSMLDSHELRLRHQSSIPISQVVDWMEEDWFVNAHDQESSALAVQTLLRYMMEAEKEEIASD